MKQPAIALMLAALVLPVVASQATAQILKLSRAEQAMHLCWASTYRINNHRLKRGNAYRSLVLSRNRKCAQAKKLAQQEQEAGKPPYKGVAPTYPWKPELYAEPSFDWFFE